MKLVSVDGVIIKSVDDFGRNPMSRKNWSRHVNWELVVPNLTPAGEYTPNFYIINPHPRPPVY